MWEKLNNFLKGQIVTSIIYIALGVCLAFMPVSAINVICKFVFGILLILVGLYHILIYILEKLNSTILDLFSGGVLMVIGIFLFMNPQVVVRLLPILLGTFVLVDSIWSLKGSLKLKKRGSGAWKFLLIGSLIFIGLGVSLVINPFTMVKYTVIFAGWIFLCNGVVDLIYLILLHRGLKELRQETEAIDTEAVIEPDEPDNFTLNEEKTESPESQEPEPEYAPWSSRNETPEPEDSDIEDVESVPEPDEDSIVPEEPSETISLQSATNVVSEATVKDEDLSDTKDETIFQVFAKKHKK